MPPELASVGRGADSASAPLGGRTPFRLGYRPHFDGMRGLAVLAVMIFHLRSPYITGGFLGVDVFFVLSGFRLSP